MGAPPSEWSLAHPKILAYNGVYDVCVAHGWAVELQWFDDAFTLEVLEGKNKTLAIASSGRLGAPGMRVMAEQIRIALERSGKLK